MTNIHNYTCDEHFLQMGEALFECLFWSGKRFEVVEGGSERRKWQHHADCELYNIHL